MLKRNLIALALCLTFILGCLPVAAEHGEEKYIYIQAVADFIRENGYYSDLDDDPLERALITMLDEDPMAFEMLLYYMMNSYDERSGYIPAAYGLDRLQTSGYVGVGVTITRTFEGEDEESATEVTQVTALNPQGSAQRAGVQIGDTVISVGGIALSGIEFSEVSEILRDGEAGSFVDMEVEREGQRLVFTLERTFLGEPEFSCEDLGGGLWKMRFSQFHTDEAMESFYAAIEAMREAGATDLIFDLRDNPGGRLDMAFEVVDALMPQKNVHYITIVGREGDKVTTDKITTPGGGLELQNIVLLCNGGTASASEIIIAGLCGQLPYAASLGERTYGKATAQYEIETPEEGLLILTAFKITTPDGRSYDLEGMSPDFLVYNEQRPRAGIDVTLNPVALSLGNCSDDAQALNQALLALGLMGQAQTAYRFGEDTQAAVNNFRQQRGLERISGIDADTVALLNAALAGLEGTTELADVQLEKALACIEQGLISQLPGAAD